MDSTIALLPDEKVITSSDGGILTLTNKRVRYDSIQWGRSHLVSVTLGSVASCSLVTKSYPLLLVLGAVALLVSFLQRGGAFVGMLVVGGVLIAAYFFAQRAVISIASNGGESILVPTKGMKREDAVAFVEAVEREILT